MDKADLGMPGNDVDQLGGKKMRKRFSGLHKMQTLNFIDGKFSISKYSSPFKSVLLAS